MNISAVKSWAVKDKNCVLHVIDSLMIGGAERVLIDQANLLANRGWVVYVLVLGGNYPLSDQLDESIEFISLDNISKLNPFCLYRVHRFCRQFSLIHVHLRYNFRYLAFVRKLFLARYSLILHDHFGDIDTNHRVPFMLDTLFSKHDYFIGVCKPLLVWANQNLKTRPEGRLLLPNIIRIKHIGPQHNELGSVINVLMVANFREAKNHEFFVDLISSLIKRFKLRVLLVGQVFDTKYFENVKLLLYKRNLSGVVEIDTSCKNIQPLLNSFDIAIHTAKRESGPLVLIEYLAFALPFLAFRTGEVAEQSIGYLSEFFLSNFDVSEWSKRFEQIIGRRKEFAGAMRNCYVNNFGELGYVTSLETFYKTVIDEQGK